MALKEYQRKRRFSITPEPAGRPARKQAKVKSLHFVIQKHRASHLHYDFRLEWDGVLLSWAVPKGPSLNPAEKHLAMAVEDHPLEYADFEGVIPAGQYGGGTVMIWDRGTYVPDEPNVGDSFRHGEIKFTLQGTKLAGGFVLVRTGGRNSRSWLLIKRRDTAVRKRDIRVSEPRSVVSNRLLAEIAFDEHGDVERAASGDPAAALRALIRNPDIRKRKPRKRPAIWNSNRKPGSKRLAVNHARA
jgi:bifunctional non-homologous end joining protein LigD